MEQQRSSRTNRSRRDVAARLELRARVKTKVRLPNGLEGVFDVSMAPAPRPRLTREEMEEWQRDLRALSALSEADVPIRKRRGVDLYATYMPFWFDQEEIARASAASSEGRAAAAAEDASTTMSLAPRAPRTKGRRLVTVALLSAAVALIGAVAQARFMAHEPDAPGSGGAPAAAGIEGRAPQIPAAAPVGGMEEVPSSTDAGLADAGAAPIPRDAAPMEIAANEISNVPDFSAAGALPSRARPGMIEVADIGSREPARPVSRGAITLELAGAAARASRCATTDPSHAGSAEVSVTFAPSGHATSAAVAGLPAGTPAARCIASAFRAARVPAFDGAPLTVRKTVRVR